MRRVFTKAAGLAAVCSLALAGAHPSQADSSDTSSRSAAEGAAYFEMTDDSRERFVIKLTRSEATITHARDLVAGKTSERPHVQTRIIKRKADYNPRYSFHTDPAGTNFFDTALDVCDATIEQVENHLDEAGQYFLPGLMWCDSSSRLTREVPAP